jgi:hypothetical protein
MGIKIAHTEDILEHTGLLKVWRTLKDVLGKE